MAFLGLASILPPLFAVMGIVGIIVVLLSKPFQRRYYDRIGWYKKYEMATPPLPCEIRPLQMRHNIGKIVFGPETIELLEYKSFTFAFKPKWKLAYSQIREVRIDGGGTILEGLILDLEDNALGKNSIKSLQIPETPNGKGELTRTILAVLEAKAPHAPFVGAKWIKEGWVPRLGFTIPNRGGGGGP